jgi:hypothetical protein
VHRVERPALAAVEVRIGIERRADRRYLSRRRVVAGNQIGHQKIGHRRSQPRHQVVARRRVVAAVRPARDHVVIALPQAVERLLRLVRVRAIQSRLSGVRPTLVHERDQPLRLQIKHATAFFQPLPLVTWHDGPTALTRESWEALSGKAVVFWASGLTPKVLFQAMAADGLISLLGPADVAATRLGKHYLRLAPPHCLLHRVIRHARPWKAALRHWAKSRTDGQVLDLLSGMKAYGIGVEELAPFCGGSRRARRLLPPAPPTRTVTVGGTTVRERPDGWHVVRGTASRWKLSDCQGKLMATMNHWWAFWAFMDQGAVVADACSSVPKVQIVD